MQRVLRKYSRFLFLLVSILASILTSAQYQPKVIMMKLRPGLGAEASAMQSLQPDFNKWNAVVYKVFPHHQPPAEPTNTFGDSLVDLSRWYQLEYKADVPEWRVAGRLRESGLFSCVERRPLNQLFYVPNDSLLGHQFYLNNIKAFDAWNVEQGDTDVVVGITDTGIDRLQEDLKDGIKYNYQDTVDGIDNDNDGFVDNFCGWDIGNNDNNVQWGPKGHGTFVSGFVSAVPDNGKGIAGVGYHTKILPVKIDNPDGLLVHDYEGIVYAADHNCSVINCSWGGPVYSKFGEDVVNYAIYNRDVLVVAACGNSNNDVWMYPAAYKQVLSVAATDSMDVRWSQSSYGSRVDLCAPGTFVYSTWVNNIYFSSHGTSFSAPMVAAAAALVKAHFPSLSGLQLGEQLRVHTDYIDSIAGNIPTKGKMGTGRLNIYKALTDTLSPSVRYTEMHSSGKDTLLLWGTFRNYLAPTSANTKAVIFSSSPYLQIIDSVFQIGALQTMASVSNAAQPFRIKIMPGIPLSCRTELRIKYYGSNYSDFEYIPLVINKDYLTIDTNDIRLTITSKGRYGFNDDAMNEGEGMIYKGGRNILSTAGLVLASSTNKVSDNIYGASGYDHDFKVLDILTERQAVQSGAGQAFYSRFNDDSAGFAKQNLMVKQYITASSQVGSRKYILLEYHIFNTGNNAVNGLYAGLYADFDIGISSNNKASYDHLRRLAYTWEINGGKYGGINLLRGKNPNVYNIDNDGSNGSVKIYDGFYSFEKYQALTQRRDSAAYGSAGGDVSSMLGAGTYNLAPGDSIIVAFAILAGDNLYDIQQSAQDAYDKYFNTASIENTESPADFSAALWPNPANDRVELVLKSDYKTKFSINMLGGKGNFIRQVAIKNVGPTAERFEFSVKDLPAGIYYLQIRTDKHEKVLKIVVHK